MAIVMVHCSMWPRQSLLQVRQVQGMQGQLGAARGQPID
jgi:hypothetical protein